MTNKQGVYTCIEEKGWIYPTESSLIEPLAGSSQNQDNVTPQSIQLSNFKTPEAESTRDPLMASPKFNKKTITNAINQEIMSSISLMMEAREKREGKRKLVSDISKGNGPTTTSLVKPKTNEGILDEKVILGETQRTSSLDLHLKMIEEQNQLEELAREKALRLEFEKQEAKERDEEQERQLEEESRCIQLELEQAQKERLIMENERL